MELQDKLYTSTQVADILGVSLRTLYRYMEDKKIDSMRTASGRHRFTKDQIMDFLNAGEMSGSNSTSQSGASSVANSSPQPNAYNNESAPAAQQPQYGNQQDQSFVNQQPQQQQVSQPSGQANSSMNQFDTNQSAQFGQSTQMNEQTQSEQANIPQSNIEEPASQYTPSNMAEGSTNQTGNPADASSTEYNDNTKSPLSSYLEQQTASATPQTSPEVSSDESTGGGTATDFTFQSSPIAEPQVQSSPSNMNVASSAAASTNTNDMGMGLGAQQQQQQQNVTSQDASVAEINTGMNIRYYKSDYSDLIELAKKIKDTAISRDLEYAFTMNAGVSLHFLIQPFTVLNFYANPEDVQLWRDELRLIPAQSKDDSNIGMVINTDIVFVATKEIGGFKVVEDKILLRDLTTSGNEDLAAKFRQKLTSI